MLQSKRFNIGDHCQEKSVQVLKFSTLPASPSSTRNHDGKEILRPVEVSDKDSRKHVFMLQKNDAVKQRFRLRYNPCSDAYHRELEDCVLTRVGGNVRGWQRGVYSFEHVERIVDTKNNLVYLERTKGSSTGQLNWKMDFTPSGLVVDQVSIKVESRNSNGGDVLVMLASGEIKKTISHMEGLGLVDVKDFQNVRNLVLSIHLIGETSEQQTRLFEKNILSKELKDEFPLDLNVTLKPPTEMYNKPIILLGLMFSNNQETSADRRHYRSHSNSSGRGFLHINIVEGKNISGIKDDLPDTQVKCYLLPDEKNLKSCKTKRAHKCSSPAWDEYFVIDGVAQSQLRQQQLGIRVVNRHVGITKKNSLLGELRIGCSNVFDFHSIGPQSPTYYHSNKQSSTTISKDDFNQTWSDTGATNRLNAKPEFYERNSNVTIPISRFDEDNGVVRGTSNNRSSIINNNNNNSKRSNSNNNKSSNNNNDNNNNEEISLKGSKVKPPRPPPPNRLNFSGNLCSSNGNRSPIDCQSSPNTADSRGKVITPTFSRLMASLPMSPERGRRLSWGGESELSLESPRGMKLPVDHQSTQSNQWESMISKPKQWIYCWKTLVVNVSD